MTTKNDHKLANRVLEILVKNRRTETLLEYITLAWKQKPILKKIDIANIQTEDYLNNINKGKNENIIRFNTYFNNK
jgi:hypothetical protein